jgi:hypothetical protein
MEQTAAAQQDEGPAVSIFDDIARDDVAVPLPNETLFSYLNRSSRLEAERVRKLVDQWFQNMRNRTAMYWWAAFGLLLMMNIEVLF